MDSHARHAAQQASLPSGVGLLLSIVPRYYTLLSPLERLSPACLSRGLSLGCSADACPLRFSLAHIAS